MFFYDGMDVLARVMDALVEPATEVKRHQGSPPEFLPTFPSLLFPSPNT